MKKIAMLSAAFLAFVGIVNAQTEVSLKNAEKNVSQKEKHAKEEKKTMRYELRKRKGEEVSSFAKQKFEEDFEGASNVTWRRNVN